MRQPIGRAHSKKPRYPEGYRDNTQTENTTGV